MRRRSRYLDTAALSWGMRAIVPNVSPPGAAVCCGHLTDQGINAFFSFNATSGFESLLHGLAHGRTLKWTFSGPPHPVLRRLLPRRRSHDSVAHLTTLVDWTTGHYRWPSGTAAGIHVIDAVQAFGLMNRVDLTRLLSLVKGGAIVLGCLHKWVGSPFPLGFLLISTRRLSDNKRLLRHLAATDYLGTGVLNRGDVAFPDTHFRQLSSLVGKYWRTALLHPAEKSLQTVFRAGGQRIREIFQEHLRLDLPPMETTGAIVALDGDRDRLGILSSEMLRHGFLHSRFERDSRVTLRLSAPPAPFASSDEVLLRAIVRSLPT